MLRKAKVVEFGCLESKEKGCDFHYGALLTAIVLIL